MLDWTLAALPMTSILVDATSIHWRAVVDDCLEQALVPTDPSSAANWTADIQPFNARVPYTPAAVAVPTTIAQIQAAANCGRTSGLKMIAKSGGHSYASLGIGGENGHLMIELDRMFGVTLNKATNVATIQPGARLGHIANQLFSQGGRAISAGTCPGAVLDYASHLGVCNRHWPVEIGRSLLLRALCFLARPDLGLVDGGARWQSISLLVPPGLWFIAAGSWWQSIVVCVGVVVAWAATHGAQSRGRPCADCSWVDNKLVFSSRRAGNQAILTGVL